MDPSNTIDIISDDDQDIGAFLDLVCSQPSSSSPTKSKSNRPTISKFPSSSFTAPSSPLQPTVTQQITSSPSRLSLKINLKRSSSNALDLDRMSKKSTPNSYRDSSIRGSVKNHLPSKNKSVSLESLLPPSKPLLTTRPEISARVVPKPQRKARTDAKPKSMKELYPKNDNKAAIRDVPWKASAQSQKDQHSLSTVASAFTSSSSASQSTSRLTLTSHASSTPASPVSQPKISQSASHPRQPVPNSPPLSDPRYGPVQRLPKETHRSTSYLPSHPVHEPHTRPVQLTPGPVSYRQSPPPPTPSIPRVPMESPSSSLSRTAPQPVRPVEDVDSLRRDNELLRQSLQSLQRKFLEKNKQLTKERSAHHETSLSLLHEKENSNVNKQLMHSSRYQLNAHKSEINHLRKQLSEKVDLEDKYRILEIQCQSQKEAMITYYQCALQLDETLKKVRGQIRYLKERNNENVRELMTKNDELANLRTVIMFHEIVPEVTRQVEAALKRI
ncbi:hypothetical protein I203_107962 [Kwoniella mangroviensis CBS 8507]|uniref:hypothetical protein n=1 Tax=Kwoniella mangroviensis CBS 8507 TaxID=1296122 RepID=UPI00080CE411|nr:uncharacterized protein I203_04856 [Kwoniella mangroviensis CBS 8507]OCF65836.1 hypothetical protein I203_04856 [Kwoniella mangroviensis CBS 8507]